MTFRCEDLERALTAGDAGLLAAARAHAQSCASCRQELELAAAVSAAARSLHREWKSEQLWPSIASQMAGTRSAMRPSWQLLAAAAVLVIGVSASLFVMRDRLFPPSTPGRPAADERLLSDEGLSEVERAEAQYVAAIESLARKAVPPADAPESALLVNLRERLLVIDAAIADCRAEIERNRFNAHLRRHLLTIYQEKRRTLEQILEQEQNAS